MGTSGAFHQDRAARRDVATKRRVPAALPRGVRNSQKKKIRVQMNPALAIVEGEGVHNAAPRRARSACDWAPRDK